MLRADANIAATLSQRAASDPALDAVLEPQSRRQAPDMRQYTRTSFAELESYANRLAHGLSAAGIRPGTRAVLMVKPSLEFFGLTFAVFKLGIVPVFIDPGMGIKGVGKCIADSHATAFIGIPPAHLARKLFGWGREHLSQFVTIRNGKSSITFKNADGRRGRINLSAMSSAVTDFQADADTTAAVLFTSGSTGPAKGVVYTHRIFNAQVSALRKILDIQPGEVDLCTFPLFALFAPALGMTSIIPSMNFTRPGQVNPLEIIVPVKRFQVTNLFGSPALLRRVQEFGKTTGLTMHTLNRVVSAGAPVPSNVIAGMTAMLRPDAQVYTPYGATESLPVACIGSNEILGATARLTAQGHGVCIGRPVPGMSVAIIPVTDDPVPEWSKSLSLPVNHVGEIVVSAEQVTQQYDARPDANAVSKIRDSTQSPPRFRHRMGDLGYFDDQGRLWFCGRKAHRVWTGQGPLDTIPTEAIFNQHPLVFRTALVGIGERGEQTPVVCVELLRDPQSKAPNWQQIERELMAISAQHAHLQQIQTFLRHPGFPVDIRHNSKIFREKLAVWAARKLRR